MHKDEIIVVSQPLDGDSDAHRNTIITQYHLVICEIEKNEENIVAKIILKAMNLYPLNSCAAAGL